MDTTQGGSVRLPRWIISIALIVVIFSVAVGGAFLLVKFKPAAKKKPLTTQALVVKGFELTPRTIRDRVIGYGTAQAERDARVAAEVSGEIDWISPALQEGQTIDANDVLIRIADREYQAQLIRAQSRLLADQAALNKIKTEETNLKELLRIARVELEVAEREQRRVEGLFESGLAGQRERDLAQVDAESKRRVLQNLQEAAEKLPDTRQQLEATVALREAELTLADIDLERCSIAAPFHGTIQTVMIEKGERVSPGQQLFRLVDTDLIEVAIEIPLSWAPRVTAGAQVQLLIEAAQDQTWDGTIVRLSPTGDASTRTLAIYAEVDNRQQSTPLRPGTFVKAVIDGPNYEQALVIPRTAIMNDHVFIATGNQSVARRLPVQIQHTIEDDCLIEGVPAGAFVITTNLDSLADDLPVTIESTNNIPAAPTTAKETASVNAGEAES
jgi:multidrug efflux pump subunit AcrA (membrane-fusion protein)